MRTRATTPEGAVLRDCLKYLQLRGVFHYRNNSRVVDLTGRGGKPRPVRFGAPGAPDIVAVIRGRYVAIECKRPDGGRLSDDQAAFRDNLVEAGGAYVVIRDVTKLAEHIELLERREVHP